MSQPELPVNMLKIEDAISFLNSFRLHLTFSQTAGYLNGLWQSANLLMLYRHYFPDDFAASTASAGIEIVYDNSSGPTCLYSPKEKEFLALVSERLFPFYDGFLLEREDDREDLIYLPTFGIEWWSIDFDELKHGWQLLLFITGQAQDELKLKSEDFFTPEEIAVLATIEGHRLDWDKFQTACGLKDEPLNFFPIAFDMLEHDTGNIFLDPADEASADPLEWSIDDMDFLIEQYTQAGVLWEKADKFLDWLVTASPHHLEEVIRLWNEFQQPAPSGNPQL